MLIQNRFVGGGCPCLGDALFGGTENSFYNITIGMVRCDSRGSALAALTFLRAPVLSAGAYTIDPTVVTAVHPLSNPAEVRQSQAYETVTNTL